MDLIQLAISALYGVVEGITEWLPISSTGHMLLLKQFIALDVSDDFWNMFLVVIQLGAILAVLVLFFHELNPFSRTKSSAQRKGTWSLWLKIIVACLPAAAIGVPLNDWMEEHLGSPYVVAVALIVYGVIFIILETARERKAARLVAAGVASPVHGRHFSAESKPRNAAETADAAAEVQSIDDLSMGKAIGVGLFQVLSLVPGTSRSGSTIIGGLLLGLSRPVAAEFTFYLAVPVMFGASLLKLVKFFLKGNTFTGSEAAILLVGCAVAFLVSILAIKFLMSFVKRHDFKPFGWYRIILGVAVIAYFLTVR